VIFQDDGHLAGASEMFNGTAKIGNITSTFNIMPSKNNMPLSLVDTAIDFSNIMPKASFKTHVTSTKVYLRPSDFFLISRLPKRTQ